MYELIAQKLNIAKDYRIENNEKEYHMFGLYTLIVMVITFICFSSVWNTYLYYNSKNIGTAVSILTVSSKGDPLKNKKWYVKVPLYIIGTTFVVPFYFIPKLIAEVSVEIWFFISRKFIEFIKDFIPNIQKLILNLYLCIKDLLPKIKKLLVDIYYFIEDLIDNYLFNYIKRFFRYILCCVLNICLVFYKRVIDSYIELRYFYTIAKFVISSLVLHLVNIKDICVNIVYDIKDSVVSGWYSLLSLFI